VRTIQLSVGAYSVSARIVAALLVATSAASLPAIGILVLLSADPPILPPTLFGLFAGLTIAPAAAAWVISRLCRAQVKVDDGLILERPGLQVTLPSSAVARVVPWIVPLPSPGLSFHLCSGRHLSWGIAAPDPFPLLDQLAECGGVEAARAAAAHPAVAYARARAMMMRRSWYHLAAKFPLFALGPTAIFFSTHQWITYGGPLGQYYLEGPGRYLQTFAVYWATVAIYLGCYASVWRGLAEACCLALTWATPHHAARARRVVEAACRVAYFAGVPAFVASRYFA
jgi:apolipoprotein N-acyltransferase